jgi:ATP-dependent DNA ligase
MGDGKDCRRESLLDRKQELRRVLSGSDARIQYVDYVDGAGISLFNQICKHDLEGIVAKQKHAPYVTDREASTWLRFGIPTIHNGQDGRNCSNVNGAESQ